MTGTGGSLPSTGIGFFTGTEGSAGWVVLYLLPGGGCSCPAAEPHIETAPRPLRGACANRTCTCRPPPVPFASAFASPPLTTVTPVAVVRVTESLMLSGLGGLAGVALGAAATAAYAASGDLPRVIPLRAVPAGFGATLAIGTVAGLYPAVRASRLSPTPALHAA